MKGLSKVMMGASVGALALTVFSGVSAEAATFSKDKAITGLTAGDSVSFDAVKSTKSGLQYNAKAKWDLYEKAGSADLSNLNTKKDSYITVKTASTTDVYKVLKDTQKKFKATCDGSKIAITVDGKEVESADITKFSWRTVNSNWTAFTTSDLDLTPYTMQGATIYIRYTGATSLTPAAGSEKVTIDGTEKTVQEIPANSFSATEFKVKVPKKANAPAITVDYVNGVIKKNKNAVYKTGANVSGALSAQWSSDKLTEDYKIDNSAAGTFMMQIAATDKKAASKIAFFSWSQTTAPTVSYTKPAVSGTTITNQKGDLIAGKLSYEAKDNAAVAKATFEITSKDADNAYDIYAGKVDAGKVVAEKKIATIAKGATKPLVLNAKKVPVGTTLYIRVAGDKKAAVLPSPFATTGFEPVYLETPKETTGA